jgi:hypothetical protein
MLAPSFIRIANSIYVEDDDYVIAEDVKGLWKIGYNLCPNCDRIIVYSVNGKAKRSKGNPDTIIDVIPYYTLALSHDHHALQKYLQQLRRTTMKPVLY